MSKWTPVYSPKQRMKVFRLRRDEGMTWPQVIARCAEGDEQVAGFTIGLSSARYLVDMVERGRRGRVPLLAETEPSQAAEALYRRTFEMVDREPARAEEAPLGKRDLVRIAHCVKRIREVAPLGRLKTSRAPEPQASTSSALADLIREEEECSGREPSVGNGRADHAETSAFSARGD